MANNFEKKPKSLKAENLNSCLITTVHFVLFLFYTDGIFDTN